MAVTVQTSKQSFASIVRQVLAILSVAFGVITASVSSLRLPVAVSTVLTIAGAVILAVEHYVSDPSTGTTPPPTQPPAAG